MMQTIGIYEKLITQLLSDRFTEIADNYFIANEIIEPNEAAFRISNYLTTILQNALETFHLTDDRLQKQIEFANALIFWIKDNIKEIEITEDLLDTQGRILTAILNKNNPIASDFKDYLLKITPTTGLSQSELFTGSNSGLSMESELKKEISSCDEINLLVSFVKWQGIRILKNELEEFARSGKKLRVITTSYMGATDQKAVNFLAELPNAEIKLSYNTENERLHAKAYLFLRNTGFHTGYIGSSNLSRSALTNGLEWNLKITTQEIPHIIDKFQNTFETYWESTDFEIYHPGNPENNEKLKISLNRARGNQDIPAQEYFFDITPHTHQKEILKQLETERNVHHRFRNLIVAATGTGKTIISAFDFQKFYNENPSCRLLFVAHREEILVQSLSVFRGILRKSNFGDLWVGNHTPEKYDQLFVSVQTLNNRLKELSLSADYYDYIIIDEVHHIPADTYKPILHFFSPKILLGLTATPERHDGSDILKYFDNRIAAELRLPEAINRRYLCPFQYFGIDDKVDLSNVSWEKGRYNPAELTNVYLKNDQRVIHILQNMEDILLDISQIKALGFCVSQEHAKYMTEKFLLNGVKASYLTSENSADRIRIKNEFTQGHINVLFVVDIYNEGVDIPEVDTILFLRPTESLTIFLQQLGRGLRLSTGKEILTVLDFVANARPEYDFSQKFRALIGKHNISILDEVEKDFPHLPLGCSVSLQKRAREIILKNISNAILTKRRLINLIQQFSEQTELPLTIGNFLLINPTVSIQDIYKNKIDKGGGWNRLCIEANRSTHVPDMNLEQLIFRGINRLLQCNSFDYLSFIITALKKGHFDDIQSSKINGYLLMLYYDFWLEEGSKNELENIQEALNLLFKDEVLKQEIIDTLNIYTDSIEIQELPLKLTEEDHPLYVHARYNRDEILAAFEIHTFDKKSSAREGVLEVKNQNIELLFVTLDKSEKRYSPTTLYKDYAINESLFHWQSQNSASPEKGKGLSYVNQKDNNKIIILFVREKNQDEYGRTMGFVNLGPVIFQSTHGSKPMNITWKLSIPLPPWFWQDAAKLAIA